MLNFKFFVQINGKFTSDQSLIYSVSAFYKNIFYQRENKLFASSILNMQTAPVQNLQCKSLTNTDHNFLEGLN